MSQFIITEVFNDITLDFSNQYDYYLIDASSGNITITLFDCNGYDGFVYRFKRVDSSPNHVTINCVSGQTFYDMANTKSMVNQFDDLKFISYNLVWYDL